MWPDPYVASELSAPSLYFQNDVVGRHWRHKPATAFTATCARTPTGFTKSYIGLNELLTDLLQIKASPRTLEQSEALWVFKVCFGVLYIIIALLLIFCPIHDTEASYCLSATVWCFTGQECMLWLIFCLHTTGGSDITEPALPIVILPCASSHQTLCLLRSFQLTISCYSEPWLPWKAQALSGFLCHSWNLCFWCWLLRDASDQSSASPEIQRVCPVAQCLWVPWRSILRTHLLPWSMKIASPYLHLHYSGCCHRVICCPFQTSPNVDSSDLPSQWIPQAGCIIEKASIS